MAVLTGEAPKGTVIRQRVATHRATLGRMLRDRGALEVRPPAGDGYEHAVIARINAGRWIADCPDEACNGAELVTRADPTFYCWSCFNVTNKHLTLPVTFPDVDFAAAIETLLLTRPHVFFMHWTPGQTLEELLTQGPFHFSWVTPITWTTGEIVTAALANAQWTGNLNATAPSLIQAALDIVYGSAANTLTRLAGGSAYNELRVNSAATALEWDVSAAQALSATGAMLYASAANALASLGIGSTGNLLWVAGGLPAWLANGSNGQALQMVSGVPAWGAFGAASLTTQQAWLTSDYSLTDARGDIGLSTSCIAGTWLVMVSLTCDPGVGGVTAGTAVGMRLWDGTTTFDQTEQTFGVGSNGEAINMSLVGIVTPGSTTVYKVSGLVSGASNVGLVKATAALDGVSNKASTIVAVKVA